MSTANENMEQLQELKQHLWKKIIQLNDDLQGLPQEASTYSKTLDGYHKLVKVYLDIIKIQQYSPGGSLLQKQEETITQLFRKILSNQELTTIEKKNLRHLKNYLDQQATPKLTLQEDGGPNDAK